MKAEPATVVVCGDCGAPMELRASRFGGFYGCTRFPACRGTHGANPDGSPKGIPADEETRRARILAHSAFDPLWVEAPLHYQITETGEDRERAVKKIRRVARGRAYRWLEERLGVEGVQSHMGSWDMEMCERVVEACRGVTPHEVREWWKNRAREKKK